MTIHERVVNEMSPAQRDGLLVLAFLLEWDRAYGLPWPEGVEPEEEIALLRAGVRDERVMDGSLVAWASLAKRGVVPPLY